MIDYLPMFTNSDNNLPHVKTHALGHASMTLHPLSKYTTLTMLTSHSIKGEPKL